MILKILSYFGGSVVTRDSLVADARLDQLALLLEDPNLSPSTVEGDEDLVSSICECSR
jgi:hypothetical protein